MYSYLNSVEGLVCNRDAVGSNPIEYMAFEPTHRGTWGANSQRV